MTFPAHVETELRSALASGRLEIPPYPVVAARIARHISADDFKLGELCSLVARDQVLSAAVVRLANSGMAAGHSPVTSLPPALSRIGAQELFRLAMRVGLTDAAVGHGHLAEVRRKIWRAAVLSAEICGVLARHRGVDPATAYMAGLLHDFGKLVCLAGIEKWESRAGRRSSEAEREPLIERYHVDAGVLVAQSWRLPEALAAAIAWHHDPSVRGQYAKLLDVIGISDRVVQLIEALHTVNLTDLSAVVGLSGFEQREIADALPRITTELAELEGRKPPAPAVTTPATGSSAGGDLATIRIDAVIHTGTPIRVDAIRIGAATLVLQSPGPFAEQQIIKILLETSSPLPLIVNVTRCIKHGEGYRIEARPFGLSGETRDAWYQLWHAARAAEARMAG